MEAFKSQGTSLLRGLEKYTKTDMVYLFKNSFWVALGQLVTALSGIVVMVLMTNLLEPEMYGQYRLITSFVLTAVIFGLPGMNMGITQSVASGYSGQLDYIVKKRMKYSLLGSGVLLMIAASYFIQGSSEMAAALVLSAVALPFFNTFFSSYFFLQGLRRFREAAVLHMLGRVFFALCMIALLLVTKELVMLVGMFFLSTIIGQYIAYRYAKKNFYVENKEKEDDSLESFGVRMSLLGAPSIVSLYLDKIVIGIFFGPLSLALYAVATMPANESMRFGRLFQQVFLPKFSADKKQSKRDFLKTLIFFTSLLWVVWAMYFFAAPYIMKIFGPEYIGAVKYSQVAMIIVCFSTVYLFQAYFVAHKMQKVLDTMFIVVPIVKSTLLLVGLYFFGLWGAIFALIGGYVFELLLAGYFYIKS